MVAKLRRKELTKEEDRSWKSHAKARNWNRSERERIRKSVLRLKSFSKGIGPDIRQKGARGDWVTILGQGAYNPKEDLRAQRSHLTRKGKEDRTRQRQGTLGIPRENRKKDSAFPHSPQIRISENRTSLTEKGQYGNMRFRFLRRQGVPIRQWGS